MSKPKRGPPRSPEEKAHASSADEEADVLIDKIYLADRYDAEVTVHRKLILPLINLTKEGERDRVKKECEKLVSQIACLAFRLREWEKKRPSLSKVVLEGLRLGRFHDSDDFRKVEPRLAARSKPQTIHQAFSRARKKLGYP